LTNGKNSKDLEHMHINKNTLMPLLMRRSVSECNGSQSMNNSRIVGRILVNSEMK
jgi:hypothetical protein